MKRYIGYFHLLAPGDPQKESTFSAVVTAANPESAADGFKKLIQNMHASIDALESGADVYLDEIIELSRIPKGGSLLRFEYRDKERDIMLMMSLGYPKDNPMASYSTIDSDKLESEEGATPEPFVVLPDLR